jgi:hypothetical protein
MRLTSAGAQVFQEDCGLPRRLETKAIFSALASKLGETSMAHLLQGPDDLVSSN